MKEIRICRCGYSGGDHARTDKCTEGRPSLGVPADATPDQVQAAILAALARELQAGAAGFATNGGAE
ncbi:hypothetical protein UFOVP154_59 [uncultured Caudovirales phage]|uniref:Uncharacterized protein n=1 Tax=uncultured Caudovirales phage TaxID=2100421 RepID=A0A6J7W8P3_9CAUD|nr:hypothetical protein UFOVP8_44 [uncultured Caudovirales phage]CAB5170956.1 hypothetical protein UFOVP154_59 [uncultured Caudovirales phage]